MYGLLFEIVEEWVIESHGVDVWHSIKEAAGCIVTDHEFVRRSYYRDSELIDIVVAASKVLSIEIPLILKELGKHFLRHLSANGNRELLRCQGSTLRQWLSNLNAMHDHIEKSFGKKFRAPVFWCEDCDVAADDTSTTTTRTDEEEEEEEDEEDEDEEEEDTKGSSILLHYYSLRGNGTFVPFVVGVVEELALTQFDIDIRMHQVAVQGEQGSEFTTWRITAVDESQNWKLSPSANEDHEFFNAKSGNPSVNFDNVPLPSQCPFSGKPLLAPGTTTIDPSTCTTICETQTASSSFTSTSEQQRGGWGGEVPLSKFRTLFPFHILVDRNFTILQVGNTLPKILKNITQKDIDQGNVRISDILDIIRPVLANSWDWKALHKLADQHFLALPKSYHASNKRVSMEDNLIKFNAAMVEISCNQVMFILSPYARNIQDLQSMKLTLSDLPLHSCQRDTVFLGEYITQEVNKAHELDKLSKTLRNERNLANTLLYNMLPQSVADQLRSGEAVEPQQYDNVTLFFSDVEGFTELCDQVEPFDVIVMLNQLYSVMDHLAKHFNLYKVETIGDAYMCCSGLPEPDEHHAENIANFAIAVMECVKLVKSPVDRSPVRLRVGIHTGHCMAGVVGTLTPHYCLFGDMVNTTARHESTGVAGRIQCSSFLYGRLKHFSAYETEQYNFTPRGLVPMKGKGDCYTYWLESGTEHNEGVNKHELKKLSSEVRIMLAITKWKAKRYFRRSGELRMETGSDTQTVSTTYSSEGERSIANGGGSDNDKQSTVKEETIPEKSSMGEVDASDKDLDGFDVASDDLNVSTRSASGSPRPPNGDTMELNNKTDIKLIVEDSWSKLSFENDPAREKLVSRICQLFLSILKLCISDSIIVEGLTDDVYNFVNQISILHRDQNSFHNFHRSCHVVVRVTYLAERTPELVTDPWNQFILAFVALIHGANHLGMSNDQLTLENHAASQILGNQSCQEKYALQSGWDIFVDEFPDLYDEVLCCCPMFHHFVRKTMLATDMGTIDQTMEKFQSTVCATTFTTEEGTTTNNNTPSQRENFRRREATLALVIIVAQIGYFSQKYEAFLQSSKLDYIERRVASGVEGKGGKPSSCHNWFEDQRNFLKNIALPLMELAEKVISTVPLKAGIEANILKWEKEGQYWTKFMTEMTNHGFGYYYFE